MKIDGFGGVDFERRPHSPARWIFLWTSQVGGRPRESFTEDVSPVFAATDWWKNHFYSWRSLPVFRGGTQCGNLSKIPIALFMSRELICRGSIQGSTDTVLINEKFETAHPFLSVMRM